MCVLRSTRAACDQRAACDGARPATTRGLRRRAAWAARDPTPCPASPPGSTGGHLQPRVLPLRPVTPCELAELPFAAGYAPPRELVARRCRVPLPRQFLQPALPPTRAAAAVPLCPRLRLRRSCLIALAFAFAALAGTATIDRLAWPPPRGDRLRFSYSASASSSTVRLLLRPRSTSSTPTLVSAASVSWCASPLTSRRSSARARTSSAPPCAQAWRGCRRSSPST